MAATTMIRDEKTPVDTAEPSGPDPRWKRLAPWRPVDGAMSWVWAGLIALIADVLRFANISFPPQKIFDEVYYAKDSHDVINHGYELNAEGDGPGLVAHPPLGKWCIGLGEQLFGYNSFGWRFSAAIAGAISVLILVRVARRLFRSTLLGCVAGLLLALDGLHFVSSRVALLDIFLMLFVLIAFACLVLDREQRRREIHEALESGVDCSGGVPHRTRAQFPWWRLGAAVAMGCALGVKWSALWFLLGFVVLLVVWEVQARRTAGVRRPFLDTIGWEAPWIAGFFVVVVLVYLATWTGWLVTDGGYNRNGDPEGGPTAWFWPDSLAYLWQYHYQVYEFHTHLTQNHTYQSNPYSWLVAGRPVLYYYESDGDCGAKDCSAAILALGTPLLWWSFIPALLACLWRWIVRRDWRAAAIFCATAAGIVPWMFYPDRTMFYFYALPALPFLILAVTLALGMILGPPESTRERRIIGGAVVTAYVLIIAICFAYFYPIYTGMDVPYDSWHERMWLDSWI